MNRHSIVDLGFTSLRAICENNPLEYIQKSQSYREKYSNLDEIHFLFIDAYAYTRVGQYELAEPILTNILSQAILSKEFFFLVHGNLLLSLCYRFDLPKVMSYLMIAEEYAREAQDTMLLAACFAFQGDYYQIRNNFKLAESLHLQVQKLLEHEGESRIKLTSLLSLANTNVSVKKYQKALQYLNEALKTSKNTHNDQFRLIINTNHANVLMKLKRYNEAEKVLIETSELSNKQKFVIHRIQALFSLGALKLECKLPNEALNYLDACHELAQKEGFNMPEFHLDLYNNFAIAYGYSGNIDGATEYINKAASIAIDIGDIVAEQEIYLNSAKMLMKVRQYVKAEALLQKCLQLSTKHRLQDHIFEVRETMAKLYLSLRNYPKCVKMMQKVQADLHKQLGKLHEMYAETQTHDFDSERTICPVFISANSSGREFVGISSAARKVLHEALLAAQHPNVSVLICGESGTGKEVLANLIHGNSIRKYHPFIPINAAAISSSLMENELFGHKKGSYTGANTDEKGYFLQANKGTLFIDEITEMPIELQAKLLRAIESRRIVPVGSSKEISFDCRIITSTNRDINVQISGNQFRVDLFHRINTIEITIPPLRDRVEDIPVLVDHFVKMFCNEFKWMEPRIKTSFIHRLQDYNFPGNIRELKNIIERLFILGESSSWDELLLNRVCNLSMNKEHKNNEDTIEREEIIKALIRFKGIRRDAAAYLMMSNSTMTRRIEKYNLVGYTAKQQTKKQR